MLWDGGPGMDLEKVKQFYRETWWLWTLYAIGIVISILYVHWIFIMAVPMILIISVYFAVVRGPSQTSEAESESREVTADSENTPPSNDAV